VVTVGRVNDRRHLCMLGNTYLTVQMRLLLHVRYMPGGGQRDCTVRATWRGGGVLQYCPGIYIDISLSKDISFSLDWSWDKGILTL
jgi:hypothetical protein